MSHAPDTDLYLMDDPETHIYICEGSKWGEGPMSSADL